MRHWESHLSSSKFGQSCYPLAKGSDHRAFADLLPMIPETKEIDTLPLADLPNSFPRRLGTPGGKHPIIEHQEERRQQPGRCRYGLMTLDHMR